MRHVQDELNALRREGWGAGAGRPLTPGPSRLAFADRLIAHSATVLTDQLWQRAHLGGRPVPAAESVKAAQAKTQTWDMQCSGDR